MTWGVHFCGETAKTFTNNLDLVVTLLAVRQANLPAKGSLYRKQRVEDFFWKDFHAYQWEFMLNIAHPPKARDSGMKIHGPAPFLSPIPITSVYSFSSSSCVSCRAQQSFHLLNQDSLNHPLFWSGQSSTRMKTTPIVQLSYKEILFLLLVITLEVSLLLFKGFIVKSHNSPFKNALCKILAVYVSLLSNCIFLFLSV